MIKDEDWNTDEDGSVSIENLLSGTEFKGKTHLSTTPFWLSSLSKYLDLSFCLYVYTFFLIIVNYWIFSNQWYDGWNMMYYIYIYIYRYREKSWYQFTRPFSSDVWWDQEAATTFLGWARGHGRPCDDPWWRERTHHAGQHTGLSRSHSLSL